MRSTSAVKKLPFVGEGSVTPGSMVAEPSEDLEVWMKPCLWMTSRK